MTSFTKRRFLTGATAGFAVALLPLPLAATPETMKQAMEGMLGKTAPNPGRVTLTIPIISETGNAVRLTVHAESPMTEADHVTRIHLFSERNPLPHIATFHIGPRAGKAEIETRVRIARDQTVLAVAEMSDGSLWADASSITVAIGACTDSFFDNEIL